MPAADFLSADVRARQDSARRAVADRGRRRKRPDSERRRRVRARRRAGLRRDDAPAADDTFPLWCVAQPVWFNRIDDPTRPFLSFLNVRWVLTEPSFPPPAGWPVLAEADGLRLLENPAALPRAFVPRTRSRRAGPGPPPGASEVDRRFRGARRRRVGRPAGRVDRQRARPRACRRVPRGRAGRGRGGERRDPGGDVSHGVARLEGPVGRRGRVGRSLQPGVPRVSRASRAPSAVRPVFPGRGGAAVFGVSGATLLLCGSCFGGRPR